MNSKYIPSYKEWLKYEADIDAIENVFFTCNNNNSTDSELDDLLAEAYSDYVEECKEEKSRADKCDKGLQAYVCKNCINNYSISQPYNLATMRNGECYICERHTIVASFFSN